MENKATASAYTAGPWEYDAGYVKKNSTLVVCDCYPKSFDGKDHEKVREIFANARLIAAAPELLEYLKGFLDDVRQMEVDPEVGSYWDWTLTKKNLEWLIDKAEGRSS